MVRIVDGKPVQVPDDARITPAMKDARTSINTFLNRLAARGPEVLAIEKAYREGVLSKTPSLDWYADPKEPI